MELICKTKTLNKIKGNFGEDKATKYLKKKGYKILQRNYKNKFGEIDIIAKYKKQIIFVEVKYRTSDVFGRPSDAVDYRKQNKIQFVAEIYLKQKKIENADIRFDIIEILNDEITHLEAAF